MGLKGNMGIRLSGYRWVGRGGRRGRRGRGGWEEEEEEEKYCVPNCGTLTSG